MIGNAPHSYLTGVPGWESEAEQALLHQLAQQVPAHGTILEIGGEFGMSASLFCKGADPSVKIFTLDLFPGDLLAHHRANLAEAGFEGRSQQIQGDSRNPGGHEEAIDLLFIDGDHTYEGVLADLNNWAGWVKPGGLLVLHDVACSTNKLPHPLHFEVSRALADWMDTEVWEFVQSVDSTLVLRRVAERKPFDNEPFPPIRAEEVAERFKELPAEAEQAETEEAAEAEPVEEKIAIAFEDMSRADLLAMAKDRGFNFPANVRTAKVIAALRGETESE